MLEGLGAAVSEYGESETVVAFAVTSDDKSDATATLIDDTNLNLTPKVPVKVCKSHRRATFCQCAG